MEDGADAYIGQQAFDGTGPLQSLRTTAPAFENHVQERALHGPQRALPGIKVLLVLQELVDELLGAVVKREGLLVLEVVQRADGQDGEQEGRLRAFRSEGAWVEEGEVVVE